MSEQSEELYYEEIMCLSNEEILEMFRDSGEADFFEWLNGIEPLPEEVWEQLDG
jgi:hypothetical protein